MYTVYLMHLLHRHAVQFLQKEPERLLLWSSDNQKAKHPEIFWAFLGYCEGLGQRSVAIALWELE